MVYRSEMLTVPVSLFVAPHKYDVVDYMSWVDSIKIEAINLHTLFSRV